MVLNMIDVILKNIIKKIPDKEVAVLMGGGVDAAVLLITCIRLN